MEYVEETPRARSFQGEGALMQSPLPSIGAVTESSERSQASGRSSPLKQLRAMELSSDRIKTKVLDSTDPNLPAALSQLLVELEDCNDGYGVISNNREAEIKGKAEQIPGSRIFRDFMFAPSAGRDQLGLTPSFDEVADLVKEALHCQDTKRSESGWNMAVHYPLLRRALYDPARQSHLVGFEPCTTARIIRDYLPAGATGKMVDFCICVNAEGDQVAYNAIERISRALPTQVINHTDEYALRNWPIAVSIETKRQGDERLAAAELQLGTWHTAQWSLLERLVTQSGGTFDGLPFLPAIVVHGHIWSFAATTREGETTSLWLEQGFGSTSNLLGVYKTVWGLQRLAKWTSDVYWPWFRKNALGVPEG